LPHHVLSLLAVGLLVVAEEKSEVPRGEILFGKVLGKHLPMLRDCARNRGDDPGGRPSRDAPLADQLYKVLRKSIIKSQSPRDPALFAPQHGGDPALGQMVLLVKLPEEGGLFEEVPFTGMSPSQDFHQGLFFFAFPDLRRHRVTQTALHRLHPQVAIDQDKGVHPLPQGDHRDDLPETLDGTGQGRNPLRPVDPRMSIAKMEMSDLDLFHFSEMSRIHDHLLARRSTPASTGKSIHHHAPAPTKMTPPTPVKPCPGLNDKNAGTDKKPYNPRGQPFGRGIIHLFFILFT